VTALGMSSDLGMVVAHPEGESISSATSTPVPALVLPKPVAVDTTIKTLYGREEGAEVGYNPHK
jgi:hypothetical protein